MKKTTRTGYIPEEMDFHGGLFGSRKGHSLGGLAQEKLDSFAAGYALLVLLPFQGQDTKS